MGYRAKRSPSFGRPGGRPGYIFRKTACRFCEREVPNNVIARHEHACEKLEPLEREAAKRLAEDREAAKKRTRERQWR